MNDEDGFLNKLLETPADETARLVYADWLDERDDPESRAKAEFIRLELRMSVAPEQSLNRVRWLNQLQKLAATLSPEWLRTVSHPRLEACRVAFSFPCPKRWDRLTPTADPNVRSCGVCKKNVHYCTTLDEAEAHATRGDCVAVTLALVRRPLFLLRPPQPPPPRIIAPSRRTLPYAVPRLVMVGGLALPPKPRTSPPPPEPPAEPDLKERRRRRRNRNVQSRDWEEQE